MRAKRRTIQVGYDNVSADRKRFELEQVVERQLRVGGIEAPQDLAKVIVKELATIEPPHVQSPPIELIELKSHGGRSGGRTTKPGNVTLNVRKLVVAIAGGALTIAGAVGAPWMMLLGGLVVWDSTYSLLQVEISEVHASVIWAMWKSKDAHDCIAKADVLRLTNEERTRFGRSSLGESEVADAITVLRKMKCIAESRRDKSRWQVRESVRTIYS